MLEDELRSDLDELEPEAALDFDDVEPEALEEPELAFFIAASNSWRLTEPSWFVSALLKSRLELAFAELPPLAEDLLCDFMAASHSERLSLPSWLVSALLKSGVLDAAALEPPAADERLGVVELIPPEVDGLFVLDDELEVDGVVLEPDAGDCLCVAVSLAYAEPAASARSENARTMGRTVISNLLW